MNENAGGLRLGIFGANCSSGRTYATLPESWVASWENNVTLAQRADAIGIECMVPIARWKGYGGESNPNGTSFESIAWACGLLAATRRIDVFCTVHVPLHHPLVAAKQMATADHIGREAYRRAPLDDNELWAGDLPVEFNLGDGDIDYEKHYGKRK